MIDINRRKEGLTIYRIRSAISKRWIYVEALSQPQSANFIVSL